MGYIDTRAYHKKHYEGPAYNPYNIAPHKRWLILPQAVRRDAVHIGDTYISVGVLLFAAPAILVFILGVLLTRTDWWKW